LVRASLRVLNAFGRDIARDVEMILGPPPKGFGCEGVYWDDFEYSRYQVALRRFLPPTARPSPNCACPRISARRS